MSPGRIACRRRARPRRRPRCATRGARAAHRARPSPEAAPTRRRGRLTPVLPAPQCLRAGGRRAATQGGSRYTDLGPATTNTTGLRGLGADGGDRGPGEVERGKRRVASEGVVDVDHTASIRYLSRLRAAPLGVRADRRPPLSRAPDDPWASLSGPGRWSTGRSPLRTRNGGKAKLCCGRAQLAVHRYEVRQLGQNGSASPVERVEADQADDA